MSFFGDIMEIVRSGSDWLGILIFLTAGAAFGVAMGRSRLNLIALAGYFSFIITKFIPWKELGFLGSKTAPDSNIQIFLFLAIILGIFFVAPRSAFSSVAKISQRSRGGWWQASVFGITIAGFLASAVISFLPAGTVSEFWPLCRKFFADDLFKFLWLLMPIVAMFVLKKSKSAYNRADED